MEYKDTRLDIELITGWYLLGGFKFGYKHDIKNIVEKVRYIIKNPAYGYQTPEKLNECMVFFNRLKNAIREHEGNFNCIESEKSLMIDLLNDEIKDLEALKHKWNNETQQHVKDGETVELKPIFKPEIVQIVFNILKDFFSPEQQAELMHVLETGNKPNGKLLFKDNGNRLTDTFKKLIENDFIIGCEKTHLINWVISSFCFANRNMVKAYVYDTVEKTISRNDNPCKSPLIEINNGQIQKAEQPKRSIGKY